MSDTPTPVIVAAAAFVAIFFTDLFRHNYKALPAHGLFGFFAVLLVSVLCSSNMYGMAWLVVFTPLLILLCSMYIKNYKASVTASKTLPPVAPPKHAYEPAPYFL